MAVASASLSYERAGWLRDRLAALQELGEQLARVRGSMMRAPFLYRVQSPNDDRVYLVKNGCVAGDASLSDSTGLNALETDIRKGSARPSAIAPDSLDEMLTIAQWFRSRPGEVDNTASTVDALLMSYSSIH